MLRRRFIYFSYYFFFCVFLYTLSNKVNDRLNCKWILYFYLSNILFTFNRTYIMTLVASEMEILVVPLLCKFFRKVFIKFVMRFSRSIKTSNCYFQVINKRHISFYKNVIFHANKHERNYFYHNITCLHFPQKTVFYTEVHIHRPMMYSRNL